MTAARRTELTRQQAAAVWAVVRSKAAALAARDAAATFAAEARALLGPGVYVVEDLSYGTVVVTIAKGKPVRVTFVSGVTP